jgi:hypothetical protein
MRERRSWRGGKGRRWKRIGRGEGVKRRYKKCRCLVSKSKRYIRDFNDDIDDMFDHY